VTSGGTGPNADATERARAAERDERFALELERARIESELEGSRVREELRRQTLRSVIRAQEAERLRIAQELHDSFGQMLASILLGLKVVEQQDTIADVRHRIADLRELTAEAAAEVRRIALELRPVALDDFGLSVALQRLARDAEERSEVTIDTDLLVETRFAREVETVFYRVAQEAITNALRHGRATRISLSLLEAGDRISLVVSDNGSGFNPGAVLGEALGIVGMRERADLIGGRLAVRSAPGEGTTVELVAPKDVIER
jgi:signal transduction histidine kinase